MTNKQRRKARLAKKRAQKKTRKEKNEMRRTGYESSSDVRCPRCYFIFKFNRTHLYTYNITTQVRCRLCDNLFFIHVETDSKEWGFPPIRERKPGGKITLISPPVLEPEQDEPGVQIEHESSLPEVLFRAIGRR